MVMQVIYKLDFWSHWEISVTVTDRSSTLYYATPTSTSTCLLFPIPRDKRYKTNVFSDPNLNFGTESNRSQAVIIKWGIPSLLSVACWELTESGIPTFSFVWEDVDYIKSEEFQYKHQCALWRDIRQDKKRCWWRSQWRGTVWKPSIHLEDHLLTTAAAPRAELHWGRWWDWSSGLWSPALSCILSFPQHHASR